MVRAIWNGAILAESEDTVRVEGNHYFPPDSVAWEYFTPSDTQTTCPWKGRASYYTVTVRRADEPRRGVVLPAANASRREGSGPRRVLARGEDRAGRRPLRIARQYGRDEWAAEDLVQETLLRAFAGYRPGHIEGMRAWLVTICLIVNRTTARRLHRRVTELPYPDVADADAASGAVDEDSRTLDRIVIADALDQLPGEQRACIVLMDIAGLTAAETADPGVGMRLPGHDLVADRSPPVHDLAADRSPDGHHPLARVGALHFQRSSKHALVTSATNRGFTTTPVHPPGWPTRA